MRYPRNVKPLARKFSIFCASLLAAAVLLAACGGQPEETTPSVLNRGIGQEPESMDPHKARTTQALTVIRDLFEGLLSYSPAGELEPGAAHDWTLSEDGLTYRLFLHDDLRWSNGDPLTAEDFVFSLRRLVDPDTAAFYAQTLSAIENVPAIVAGDAAPETMGVTAVDATTLEIRLTRRVPYFLDLLTHPAAFPVHEASLAQHGEQFSRPGVLISNGAYRLDGWVLGSVIELSANEHYRDADAVAIPVVRHHVVQEPGTELSRYLAGELDVTSTIPPEAFENLRATQSAELHIAPVLSVYFYGMNLNYEPLGNDKAFREALSLAVDREELVTEVTGRGEEPAYSFVPPGVANYDGPELPAAGMSDDERIAEARRLYAEAGYDKDNPPKIELRYNTSQAHKNIALAVQGMWRDVLGLEVELINEEFRVLVANMRAMEITQLFRLSWSGDYNDADSFLSLFRRDDPSNMFGYSSGDFDDQLADAAAQSDADRRRLYQEEAERVVLSDHVVIPLYFPVSKHLVRANIRGWQDNVLDYHYSHDLSFE